MPKSSAVTREMSALQSTREGTLLGGGVEAAEFTMMPDLDTFAVLP